MPEMQKQIHAECAITDPRTRVLLMAVREALLMVLGALEDYLCIQRTKEPNHKR